MAEVAQTTPPIYNVNGKLRDQYYTVTGTGNAGDTLHIGIDNINWVSFSSPTGATILSWSVAPVALPGTGSVLTFQTSAAAAGLLIHVAGN
jgi:hypothetical protein